MMFHYYCCGQIRGWDGIFADMSGKLFDSKVIKMIE